jgi:uncharacterized protein YutE (UPF0331/DUF86 family)
MELRCDGTNALVHGYLGLDVQRMHQVLNVHLEEVREFAHHIDTFVRRESV